MVGSCSDVRRTSPSLASLRAVPGAHCAWDFRGQPSASDSASCARLCTGGVKEKPLSHWQEINLQTQAWGLITHFIILACIALSVNLQWTKEIVTSCCFEKEGDNSKEKFKCLKLLLLRVAPLFAKAGGMSPASSSVLDPTTWKTSESPIYVLIWAKTKGDEAELSSQSLRSLRVKFSNTSKWSLEIFLEIHPANWSK